MTDHQTMQILESFYSLQGEGLHLGVPSVFLRLTGCNFKCAGFGMPKGQLSDEYRTIPVHQYNALATLPTPQTGCDSYAAWDPRCSHLIQKKEVGELAKSLLSITPESAWISSLGQPVHLVITGGEPLLGWQKSIPKLLSQPQMVGLQYLTFETNATQKLKPAFIAYFESNQNLQEVLFTCSPKLSSSGESVAESICPDVVAQYAKVKNAKIVFKFVVMSEACIKEAAGAMKLYREAGISARAYCMPVGSHSAPDQMKFRKKIAELALAHGFCFSTRLHVDLWDNAWST